LDDRDRQEAEDDENGADPSDEALVSFLLAEVKSRHGFDPKNVHLLDKL